MTIADTGPWTLPVYIVPPIMGLVTIALLAFAVWMFIGWREDRANHYGDPLPFLFAWIGGLASAALVAGLTAVGFYPWTAEHHQWRQVSGTIATVDSRILSSGDSGVSERYVVTFEGSEQQFGIDDTRAAAIEPGDAVTIACKKEWQYAAADGYGCRWAQ